MLTTLLKDTKTLITTRIEQVLSQTKDGLNGAYSQLRELLAAPLKIEEGSFDTALAQTGDEFGSPTKADLPCIWTIAWWASNLTATEQVDFTNYPWNPVQHQPPCQAKMPTSAYRKTNKGKGETHQRWRRGATGKDDSQHHYGAWPSCRTAIALAVSVKSAMYYRMAQPFGCSFTKAFQQKIE